MAAKPLILDESVLVSRNGIDIYLPKNFDVLDMRNFSVINKGIILFIRKEKNRFFEEQEEQDLNNTFLNKTFDYKNKTYKITKVSSKLAPYISTEQGTPGYEMPKRSISVYRITLEVLPTEDSPAVKKYKEENKKINEELLVFSDYLEEKGYLAIAEKIRKLQKKNEGEN